MGDYTLPDNFENKQQAIEAFEKNVYGAYPKEALIPEIEVLEEGSAFEGLATRKQVRLSYAQSGAELHLQLLMYTPVQPPEVAQVDGEEKGYPVVVMYNLEGNHTIINDEDVVPSTVYEKRLPGVVKKFFEKQRGKKIAKEHVPIEQLLKEGFAVATLYYGDVDPDYDDGFKNGMHALYREYTDREDYPGSMSAWAWGLSRVADYLETEAHFDKERIGLFGFSRLGKAALWAAANDERFKVVISDSSGLGGAGLARRNFGETVHLITYRFPHWFTGQYAEYAGREQELPVDQHQLLGLIAPRSVLISVATHDAWSDPRGEVEAVEASESESVHSVVHDGKHAVTEEEWADYLVFLKNQL